MVSFQQLQGRWKLEEAGQLLLSVIRHNKGGTNKDLGKFRDQILALVQKWDR